MHVHGAPTSVAETSAVIPADASAYLDHAVRMTDDEQRRFGLVAQQLPARIADAHTHVARVDDVDRLGDDVWSHAVSTFPWYPLDLAGYVRTVLWPEQAVWSLRIPYPIRGYHHRAINQHLRSAAPALGDKIGRAHV